MHKPGIHRKAPLSMDPIHPWFTCNSSTSNFIIISTFKSPGASYTHTSNDSKTLIIIISMIEYIGSSLLKINNQNLHNISLLRPLSIYVRKRRQKMELERLNHDTLLFIHHPEILYYYNKKTVIRIKNDA